MRITLHKNEASRTPPFSVIRLAGSGAGEVTSHTGPIELSFRGETISRNAEVVRVVDVRFEELNDQHASKILDAPRNSVGDLRAMITEYYRTRPQWDGARTLLRIIDLDY